MRILSFFPIVRPGEDNIWYSGGEIKFIEISKRWIKLGNEVHVIGSDYAYQLSSRYGFNPTKYYVYKTMKPWWAILINIKRALNKLPSGEFDFIYCPDEAFLFLIPSVLFKNGLKIPLIISANLFTSKDLSFISSIKSVFNLHARDKFVFKKIVLSIPSAFLVYIRNIFLRLVDFIFVVSNQNKEFLKRLGIEDKRIYAISSAIDYTFIKNQNLNPEEEKIYDVCFMAEINPRKGIFDLINMWKMLINIKHDAMLIIIGTGEMVYLDKVRNFIKEHNLIKNIKLAGFVTGKRKYRLMNKSKIFVYPSYNESFAQVICEAMACGLPVIAYNLPVYYEWYLNDIIYVEKGDLKNLMNKTLALLNNDKLRRRMASRGFRRANQYDYDRLVENQLEVIVRVLNLKD